MTLRLSGKEEGRRVLEAFETEMKSLAGPGGFMNFLVCMGSAFPRA